MNTIYSQKTMGLWRTAKFRLRSRTLWAVVLAIIPLILPHSSDAQISLPDSETEQACRPIAAKEAMPAVIITDKHRIPPIGQYESGLESKHPPTSYIDKAIPVLLEGFLLHCSFIEILPLSAVIDSAKQNRLGIDAERTRLTTLVSANILQNDKRYYLLRWSHIEQQGLVRLRITLSRVSENGTIDGADEIVSDLYTLTKSQLNESIDRVAAKSARIISEDTPNLSRQPLKVAVSCFIQIHKKRFPGQEFISPGSALQKLFINQLMLRLRAKNSLTIQFIEPDIEGCLTSKSGQNVVLSPADGIIQGRFETNKDFLEIWASASLSTKGNTIFVPLPIVRNPAKSDLSFLVMADLLSNHISTFLAGAVERNGTWKASLLEEVYGNTPDWNEATLRRLFNRGIDLYLTEGEPDLSTSILHFVFSKLNPEVTILLAQGFPGRQDRLDLASSVKDHLGRILIAQKRFPSAIAEFEESLKYNPNNADAAFDLASTWGYLKNLGKARSYYRQTVAIEPTNQFARRRLAELALKFGDYDEAENNFRKLLELDPASSSMKNGLADALVGQGVMAFESKCDRTLALLKLEEAISFDPASDWLRLNVAELSLLTEQPEKARKILDAYLFGSSPESFRLQGVARETARFAGEYMSILSRAAMGEDSIKELQGLQGKALGLKIADWNWDFAYLDSYLNAHNGFSQDFKSLAIAISSSVAVKGKQSPDPSKGRPCMTGSNR